MKNEASDFPALLNELRGEANAGGLSPQEARALISSYDYAESVYQTFVNDATSKDERGNWEPPLSRTECRELLEFMQGYIKQGRAGAPVIIEMALSPESRKYALGFHAALRLFAEWGDVKLVFVSPDEKSADAARRYWSESSGLRKLAQDRCAFLTWEEVVAAPLEGAAVVGDADLSGISDDARREAVRQRIAHVKEKKGVGHLVLLVTKG